MTESDSARPKLVTTRYGVNPGLRNASPILGSRTRLVSEVTPIKPKTLSRSSPASTRAGSPSSWSSSSTNFSSPNTSPGPNSNSRITSPNINMARAGLYPLSLTNVPRNTEHRPSPKPLERSIGFRGKKVDGQGVSPTVTSSVGKVNKPITKIDIRRDETSNTTGSESCGSDAGSTKDDNHSTTESQSDDLSSGTTLDSPGPPSLVGSNGSNTFSSSSSGISQSGSGRYGSRVSFENDDNLLEVIPPAGESGSPNTNIHDPDNKRFPAYFFTGEDDKKLQNMFQNQTNIEVVNRELSKMLKKVIVTDIHEIDSKGKEEHSQSCSWKLNINEFMNKQIGVPNKAAGDINNIYITHHNTSISNTSQPSYSQKDLCAIANDSDYHNTEVGCWSANNGEAAGRRVREMTKYNEFIQHVVNKVNNELSNIRREYLSLSLFSKVKLDIEPQLNQFFKEIETDHLTPRIQAFNLQQVLREKFHLLQKIKEEFENTFTLKTDLRYKFLLDKLLKFFDSEIDIEESSVKMIENESNHINDSDAILTVEKEKQELSNIQRELRALKAKQEMIKKTKQSNSSVDVNLYYTSLMRLTDAIESRLHRLKSQFANSSGPNHHFDHSDSDINAFRDIITEYTLLKDECSVSLQCMKHELHLEAPDNDFDSMKTDQLLKEVAKKLEDILERNNKTSITSDNHTRISRESVTVTKNSQESTEPSRSSERAVGANKSRPKPSATGARPNSKAHVDSRSATVMNAKSKAKNKPITKASAASVKKPVISKAKTKSTTSSTAKVTSCDSIKKEIIKWEAEHDEYLSKEKGLNIEPIRQAVDFLNRNIDTNSKHHLQKALGFNKQIEDIMTNLKNRMLIQKTRTSAADFTSSTVITKLEHIKKGLNRFIERCKRDMDQRNLSSSYSAVLEEFNRDQRKFIESQKKLNVRKQLRDNRNKTNTASGPVPPLTMSRVRQPILSSTGTKLIGNQIQNQSQMKTVSRHTSSGIRPVRPQK